MPKGTVFTDICAGLVKTISESAIFEEFFWHFCGNHIWLVDRAFRMYFPVFRFRAFSWDTARGQLGCSGNRRPGQHARPFVKKGRRKRRKTFCLVDLSGLQNTFHGVSLMVPMMTLLRPSCRSSSVSCPVSICLCKVGYPPFDFFCMQF